jgi:hypothetical protein
MIFPRLDLGLVMVLSHSHHHQKKLASTLLKSQKKFSVCVVLAFLLACHYIQLVSAPFATSLGHWNYCSGTLMKWISVNCGLGDPL